MLRPSRSQLPGTGDRSAPPAAGTRPRRRDLRTSTEGRSATGPAFPVALLWVLIGAVLIALALLLLWGLSQQDDSAVPASAPTTEETSAPEALVDPAATPSEQVASPGADAVELAAAAAALDDLAEGSGCDNLYSDAGVFHDYTQAAGAEGSWVDLVSARRPAVTLDGLDEQCDPDYTRRLTRYIIDDPRSEELLVRTLQDHVGELPQDYPPPAAALFAETFRTDDKNIECTLTHDGVGCSIDRFTFTQPCLEGGAGPFSVALFSTEVYPCAGTITGGATSLSDGESTTVGNYACAVAGHAVRCWHTVSGTEFELAADRVDLG